MKQEEKYKELIGKLGVIKPEISHPDLLTKRVMNKISIGEVSSTIKIIRMVRPWLATASVFFLGLFLYQQLETPKTPSPGKLVFSDKKLSARACIDSLALKTNNKEQLIKTYLYCVKKEELKKKNSELLKEKFLSNYNF
jgi:hypothetical protein